MRGLYAIVDQDTLGTELIPFAEAVLRARPAALQLRAKQAGARETLALLRALVPLCRAQGVPLFANDRPDLAVLAGTDGVHVGQEDLPVAEVRAFAPKLRVGVSTHTADELAAALEATPDYVAFGPVFATRSKAQPDDVVGLGGLERASRAARSHGVPLVAIGGIDAPRAASIAPLADAAAVIAALGRDPAQAEATARALHLALGGAP